jgi:hypothetical protein
MIGNEEEIKRASDDVKQLFHNNPFSNSKFLKKENEAKIAYLNNRGNCFGIGIEYTRRAINAADRPAQKSTITKFSNSHLKKDSNLARRIDLYQSQTHEYFRLNKEKYSIEIDTTDLDSFFNELISRLNHSSIQALNSRKVEGFDGHVLIFRKDGDEYIVFDSVFGEFKTRDIGELKSAFKKMRVLYSFENIDFTNVDLYDVKQLVEDLGITRKSRGAKNGSYKDPEIITIIHATYETVKNIFDNSTPQEIQNLIFYESGVAFAFAVDIGDAKLVELLLSQGAAGVSFKTDEDRLFFMDMAVKKGHIDVFHVLNGNRELDQKSVVSLMDSASQANQFSALSVLLDTKFEIKDKEEYLPILKRVLEGEMAIDVFEKLINKFIDRGASTKDIYPDGIDEKTDSPLMTVMTLCSDETVKRFIEAGADVNHYNKETQCSALSAAISNDRTEIIQMLVDNGIDVNKSLDMQGYEIPPTLYAASINNLKSFDKLLSLGGNVDAELTSVYFASAIGHENVEMIARFIELGMDVNVELNGGETVLNKALELGHVEITKKLLEAGADVSTLKEEDIKKASPEIQKLISDHNDKLVEKEAASPEKKKPGHVARLVAYHDKRIDERRPDKPQKKSGHAAKVEETRSADSKSRQ